MFTIENATIKDVFDLRNLEKECFSMDAWPMFDLAGVLLLPGIIRLKAVANRQMAGFVAGETGSSRGICWISTIGVAQKFRRQGIGIALLQACEDKMASPDIRLTVRKSNETAIQMYLSNGYHILETWSNYYHGGEDGIVMRKLRAR